MMDSPSDPRPLLQATHALPCPMDYKLIAEASPTLAADARAAIEAVTGCLVPPARQRLSAAGRHCALTFAVYTHDAQQALDIFAALARIPGARMVL